MNQPTKETHVPPVAEPPAGVRRRGRPRKPNPGGPGAAGCGEPSYEELAEHALCLAEQLYTLARGHLVLAKKYPGSLAGPGQLLIAVETADHAADALAWACEHLFRPD